MTEPEQTSSRSESVTLTRALALLAHGVIEMQGQFPWSSNYTFLISVRHEGLQSLAVYKPCRGERPLWDFQSNTLCQREVAAYMLSRYLGWPDIPPVVLREGPEGAGSVQLFVEADYQENYFTLRHKPEFIPAFQRVALFDYLVNNADRKGGHLLRGAEDQIWAIDHGLTFHTDYKLRTVIWEHAGQPYPPELCTDLRNVRTLLKAEDSPLRESLGRLLDEDEILATLRRLDELIEKGVFPQPRRNWRNTPYPLV